MGNQPWPQFQTGTRERSIIYHFKARDLKIPNVHCFSKYLNFAI